MLAAGIPFALFPASPTPYELKHLVKVSKVRKVFTSPRNFENARIVAKEAGFSESDGIFILEGKVEGKRSFDDLVCSVKEPAKNYVKTVNRDALAYLIFSSGTTGPPKGEALHKAYRRRLTRAHNPKLLAVMISHRNIMFSAMQGFVTGMLNNAVAVGPPWIQSASACANERHQFSSQPPRPTSIPVILIPVPFYHGYGLNMFCFRSFALPCTLVIMSKWDPKLALNLIPKYAPSLMSILLLTSSYSCLGGR